MKNLFSKIKSLFRSKCFLINKVHNNYFILRHGETDYTADMTSMIYPKSTRFELGITEKGKEDIKKLIPEIKGKNIDLIFASDFLRAKITAKIIADIFGIDIILDKRLRDINLGVYRGGPKKDFYDGVSQKEMLEKGPREGESWMDCACRMESFIKEVEKKYKNKNILIVSHGDPLWLLERAIALKEDPYKLAEERLTTSTLKPGEFRTIVFK